MRPIFITGPEKVRRSLSARTRLSPPASPKGPHDVPAELEREEDRMEERLEQQMLDKEDAK